MIATPGYSCIHWTQSFHEVLTRLIQIWGFCLFFVWHGDIPSINKTLAEKDVYIYIYKNHYMYKKSNHLFKMSSCSHI